MRLLILSLLCGTLLSCQSNHGYQAESAAEARAYARRAVEVGAVHKGGEEALVTIKSIGKPQDGQWNQQKMEKFFARFASENPRLAEINLASTRGAISEKERLMLIAELEANQAATQAAEAERKAARSHAIAASLNNVSASLNQTTANINRDTAIRNQNTVNSLNSGLYTRPYTPTYTPTYTPSYTPSYTPLYSKPGTVTRYSY